MMTLFLIYIPSIKSIDIGECTESKNGGSGTSQTEDVSTSSNNIAKSLYPIRMRRMRMRMTREERCGNE